MDIADTCYMHNDGTIDHSNPHSTTTDVLRKLLSDNGIAHYNPQCIAIDIAGNCFTCSAMDIAPMVHALSPAR